MPIVIANWKMNKSKGEAQDFIFRLSGLIKGLEGVQIFIAPSYTLIEAAKESSKGSAIIIGAQNMCAYKSGPFTGEVSADMLRESGAHFVLLGHSERRTLFSETDDIIHEKLERAVVEGLQPILCIGETLEEREKGKTRDVLERQLKAALQDLSSKDLRNLILAYEPIWAIGTGRAATTSSVREVQEECRSLLEGWGIKRTPILYGGSVKPSFIEPLMKEGGVDGVLIGNASLDVDLFYQCIECAKKVVQ